MDFSDDPNSIRLVGGNDNQEGNTDFTITAVGSGDIKFRWSYFSTDTDGANWDPAGYLLNGAFTALVDDSGPPNQSGEFSITITEGEEFGFRVFTLDGSLGAGELTIFDFAPFRNTAPKMSPINNQYVGLNSVPFDIDLEDISSGVGETQVVAISATSSNTDIIADPVVTYTSPNDFGTLTISPQADATGSATITVTLMDDGGTDNGGVDTYQTQFDVIIQENFPPTLVSLNPRTIPLNSDFVDINLSGISSGINTSEFQNLMVMASSNDLSLISVEEVDYTSPSKSNITYSRKQCSPGGQIGANY